MACDQCMVWPFDPSSLFAASPWVQTYGENPHAPFGGLFGPNAEGLGPHAPRGFARDARGGWSADGLFGRDEHGELGILGPGPGVVADGPWNFGFHEPPWARRQRHGDGMGGFGDPYEDHYGGVFDGGYGRYRGYGRYGRQGRYGRYGRHGRYGYPGMGSF